jgi:uncharacterized protein YacL
VFIYLKFVAFIFRRLIIIFYKIAYRVLFYLFFTIKKKLKNMIFNKKIEKKVKKNQKKLKKNQKYKILKKNDAVIVHKIKKSVCV